MGNKSDDSSPVSHHYRLLTPNLMESLNDSIDAFNFLYTVGDLIDVTYEGQYLRTSVKSQAYFMRDNAWIFVNGIDKHIPLSTVDVRVRLHYSKLFDVLYFKPSLAKTMVENSYARLKSDYAPKVQRKIDILLKEMKQSRTTLREGKLSSRKYKNENPDGAVNNAKLHGGGSLARLSTAREEREDSKKKKDLGIRVRKKSGQGFGK